MNNLKTANGVPEGVKEKSTQNFHSYFHFFHGTDEVQMKHTLIESS